MLLFPKKQKLNNDSAVADMIPAAQSLSDLFLNSYVTNVLLSITYGLVPLSLSFQEYLVRYLFPHLLSQASQ